MPKVLRSRLFFRLAYLFTLDWHQETYKLRFLIKTVEDGIFALKTNWASIDLLREGSCYKKVFSLVKVCHWPVVDVIKAGRHMPHAIRRTPYALRPWQWRKFTRVFTPLDGSASVIYGRKNVL